MILALAGNPNCGKTTLFNALTGANARTGNFPGVTVTRSTGVCRARPDVTLVDLPGVYALRPFSDEERVTRAYLLGGEPDAIISIADATCPARSLYLTLQLLELGVPVVLALNVMDALRADGGAVDTAGLAQALGIPVVPVSAALGEGLDTLLDAAVRAAQGAPPDPWHALAPGAVQSCVRTLARVLADEARRAGLPPVFAATQWLDGAHGDHAPEAARQAVARMERETGLTRGEALPTARFAQVDRLTRFFTLPQTLPGHRRSARIDRVLTGRYTAYPAMAALLGGVWCLTFHVVGPCLSRLLAHAITWLADAADGALLALDAKPLLRALVREGVFAGVGSVARSRKCRREPAGRGWAGDRAGVCAARLRRLARRDRARDRAAGQGDGAVHARRAARGRADGGAAAGVLPRGRRELSRVHGAVCAVRGGAGGHASGTRQQTRCICSGGGILRGGLVHRGSRLPHRDMDIRKQQTSGTGSLLFFLF